MEVKQRQKNPVHDLQKFIACLRKKT